MISKSIQLEDQVSKRECIQDASSQLDMFISYVEKQGANYDLIQSTESVKAILPDLLDQLIRGGYIRIDVSDT